MNIWIRTFLGAVIGALAGFLVELAIPAIPVVVLPIPVVPKGVLIGALLGAFVGALKERLVSALEKTYDDFLDWRANRAQARPELEAHKELQKAGREAIKKARKTRKFTGKLVEQQEKSLKVIDRIVKKVESTQEKEAQEEIDQRLKEAAELVRARETADPTLLQDVLRKAEALRKVRFDKQKRQTALQTLQTAIANLQQAP